MRRAVLLVFLTLLTFDVSGLGALCGDGPCDERCPADLSGGQCPPNCHDCPCCSLPKIAAMAVVTLVSPLAHAASWSTPSDRHSAPEPADILHVPKLSLA